MGKKCLVIVDPEVDFIEGGTLAVEGAKKAMDNLVDYLNDDENFKSYDLFILTKDFHPANHCSFRENGGLWPAHCVMTTPGSAIYRPLYLSITSRCTCGMYTIIKGDKADVEEYSAFAPTNEENYKEAMVAIRKKCSDKFKGLSDCTFVIAGIAGDYCVKNTVLDMMADEYLGTAKYELLEDCIASIDGGEEVEKLKKEIEFHNRMVDYGPIIKHFTDNDLYTFTCQYFALMKFPRAIIKYRFFDRNHTQYPPGFARELAKQLKGMERVVITEPEIEFMKSKIDFLPDWYYTFLRGFRFNFDELFIRQTPEGELGIDIEGPWWSAIFWEMPVLSTISEMMHLYNGHIDQYDAEKEYKRAYAKALEVLEGGVNFADMGTRRRFSFNHHRQVISAMKQCQMDHLDAPGRITGTSNVWFAKEFDMTPIGTMSHQVVSFVEGTMSNPFEVNYMVMDMWSELFDGNCGIYLNDCFTSKTFLNSLSLRQAKLWDGVRVDSGDEYHETDITIDKWKSLGLNPIYKTIGYSNGLDNKMAIALTKYCEGKCQSFVGQGTYNTCNVDIPGCNPMNIIVKAIEGRITEKREPHPLIKISNDPGKSVGDPDKCKYTRKIIEESTHHY